MPSFLRRHLRVVIVAFSALVALVVFVLVWFQPQKALLNTTVNESLPGRGAASSNLAGDSGAATDTGQSNVLARGQFRSLEHHTTGRAVLVRLSNGDVLLRLERLDTLNGPDLHVYLSEVAAGGDARAYGERFVDLGKLKGNKGNQNYRVPAKVDVSRYRSAVIWCKRFTVGFGVAALV
jgi:hypothetical protein